MSLITLLNDTDWQTVRITTETFLITVIGLTPIMLLLIANFLTVTSDNNAPNLYVILINAFVWYTLFLKWVSGATHWQKNSTATPKAFYYLQAKLPESNELIKQLTCTAVKTHNILEFLTPIYHYTLRTINHSSSNK